MPDRISVSSSRGILIVDDDESIRELLKVFLVGQGYAVWLATDGNEALRLYKEHWRRIGAVLMDVQMPGRDGPSTLVTFKKVAPLLPVCLMTGDSGNYTLNELIAMGADSILSKPLSLAVVAETLQGFCMAKG